MRVMVDDLDIAAVSCPQPCKFIHCNDLAVANEKPAILEINECFGARLAGQRLIMKGQNTATQQ